MQWRHSYLKRWSRNYPAIAQFPLALKASAKKDPDSPSFQEAMTGPYWDKFLKVMRTEIHKLESHSCWDVVSATDVTEGVKVLLHVMRVFKIKHFPDGWVHCFKAWSEEIFKMKAKIMMKSTHLLDPGQPFTTPDTPLVRVWSPTVVSGPKQWYSTSSSTHDERGKGWAGSGFKSQATMLAISSVGINWTYCSESTSLDAQKWANTRRFLSPLPSQKPQQSWMHWWSATHSNTLWLPDWTPDCSFELDQDWMDDIHHLGCLLGITVGGSWSSSSIPNFVASTPMPGYEVIKTDLPLALPDWFLSRMNPHNSIRTANHQRQMH